MDEANTTPEEVKADAPAVEETKEETATPAPTTEEATSTVAEGESTETTPAAE